MVEVQRQQQHLLVVTVEASDGGQGTTAMKEVTIVVTNVDEPGTVTLSTLQPQVDVAITATLDRPGQHWGRLT